MSGAQQSLLHAMRKLTPFLNEQEKAEVARALKVVFPPIPQTEMLALFLNMCEPYGRTSLCFLPDYTCARTRRQKAALYVCYINVLKSQGMLTPADFKDMLIMEEALKELGKWDSLVELQREVKINA